MNWFQHHPVLLGLIGALVAIGYGMWLTVWLLQQPDGNDRMREIARAVQEGATAYLRKQYTTIAIAGVVILIIAFAIFGWQVALGYLIGASFSGIALGVVTAIFSLVGFECATAFGEGCTNRVVSLGAMLKLCQSIAARGVV